MTTRFLAAASVGVLWLVGAPATEAQQAAPAHTIRVLVTWGGHEFSQKDFFRFIDSLPGTTNRKVARPQFADLLKPGLEKQYDVLLMYDMTDDYTPPQRAAFVALLNRGIGLLSLHHNLVACQGWDEYPRIVGGRYVTSGAQIEGKTAPRSTASDGEHIRIRAVNRHHPITRGLADFEIVDETYGKLYLAPGNEILLKTDHPKASGAVAWARNYGHSRVFATTMGHDATAYNDPNFRKIIARAVDWLAGTSAAAGGRD
jgi:uncharacterized protein